MLPKRGVTMCCHPIHLHIHQRIVRDIDGIGNISQPFANGGTFGVRSLGTGAGKDDEREQDQDAQCLIESVGNALFSANARDSQDDDDGQ